MVDPTVFDTPVVDNTPAVPTPDSLIGEGKKYATEADALASVPAAQQHITTLEGDNAALKQQLEELQTSTTSMDQVLEALQQRNAPVETPETTGGINEADLASMVNQVVDNRSAEDKKASNISAADMAAQKLFGEKAGQVVADKASELGLSVDYLMQVAGSSPSAFIKLVSEGQTIVPPAGGSSGTSTINTEVLDSHSSDKNSSYYRKMRLENPSQYKTTAVQQEMMRSRGELGADRFNK